MFELIRKSILAGIGAIAYTEEKTQELIAEFVQKGELTQKEGDSLFHELQHAVDNQKTKITATVEEQVTKILHELNVVTKKDLAELEQTMKKEFTKIEKQIAKLEKEDK
jgi:polyhydroxyalkanoate synthesis regulator phasin